jgi:hypothetical protein
MQTNRQQLDKISLRLSGKRGTGDVRKTQGGS